GAKALTKFVIKLGQEGLDGLKKIPADFPLPPSTIAAMRKALESIQIQPKGVGVEGAIFVPREALMSGPGWFLMRSSPALPDRPPPPPPDKRQSRLAPWPLVPEFVPTT